jgi:hypothetical protein
MLTDTVRIPGFSGYSITTDGRVFSRLEKVYEYGRRGVKWIESESAKREMRPDLTRAGYLRYTLRNDNGVQVKVFAHRLVYMTFVGEIPPSLIVRHLDDNKLNNTPENLALGTVQDNANDAKRNGGTERGASRHRGAKRSDAARANMSASKIRVKRQVVLDALRDILLNGERSRVVAKRYGISEPMLSLILSGRHRFREVVGTDVELPLIERLKSKGRKVPTP